MTNNGGQAFPGSNEDSTVYSERLNGMTMRQHYKGMALNGLAEKFMEDRSQADDLDEMPVKKLVDFCGFIADAMIKEDEEHEEKRSIPDGQRQGQDSGVKDQARDDK